MINITAFTWYLAASVSIFVAYQIFIGWKKIKSLFFSRFAIAISIMTISFVLFGSTWTTPNPLILKTMLFFGHLFLWLSFIPLGDIIWQTKLTKLIPRWLPAAFILLAGSSELYLEWTCKQSPYVVHINDFFSVTQVQLCLYDFLVLTILTSVFLIPMGIIFIQEAMKMEKKLKVKSIGYGLTFLLASVGGSLITLKQPPLFLLIEDMVIITGFTVLLMVNIFAGGMDSREDKIDKDFKI